MLKQKKQIHVITKFFFPVAAGIETNIMETYKSFVKKNWNITIHTSKDTLTEKNILKKKEVMQGMTVRRYAFHWFGYFPKIQWNSADVVCLHNFNIAPHIFIMLYTLFLKITGQKKFSLVLIPHGGYNPEWSVFPVVQRFVKRLYHRTIGRILMNLSVDGIRAVSEWERQEMIKEGVHPDLIVVITNGVENEAYEDLERKASLQIKQKVQDFGTYIIQIGRIYPIKNYETVIRAMALLPKNIKFVIAGPRSDDTYYENLKKLSRELGVESRVIFLGVVRGVDKYYLIKHAQMMVHMAIWESFCNVVHEGLSQGLVCLVANNTALPLLIHDGINGYCIETHDYKSVAEKVKHVLKNKDSEQIKQMQKRNKVFGLENSWKTVSRKVEIFYQSLMLKLRYPYKPKLTRQISLKFS